MIEILRLGFTDSVSKIQYKSIECIRAFSLFSYNIKTLILATNSSQGFHVQVNARNEDDIEEETIKEKVKNASGAKFSVHKEKAVMYEPQGVIGSVYQKSKPHLDTNIAAKNEFWKKDQVSKTCTLLLSEVGGGGLIVGRGWRFFEKS